MPPRPLAELPDALGDASLWNRLAKARIAVFLDYDGTLTPIVDRPGDARLADSMRTAVRALAERVPVFVVTGRDLPSIRALLEMDELTIAANHGFDIRTPDGEVRSRLSDQDRGMVRGVEAWLHRWLSRVPGATCEPKASSVAVHMRQVAPADRDEVARLVDRVIAEYPGRLRATPGRMVFEIQPDVRWDKGCAVRELLEGLPPGAEVMPVYLGDDLTDERAFAVVRERGAAVVVGRPEDPEMADRQTVATHRLDGVHEVEHLLTRLADRGPVSSR